MNLKDYQGAVINGSLASEHADPLSHFTLGLAGEAGEVCNLVLKSQRKADIGTKPLDINKMLDELGDVLWYLTALSTLYGYSIEELAQINYEKLSARWPGRYPTLGTETWMERRSAT